LIRTKQTITTCINNLCLFAIIAFHTPAVFSQELTSEQSTLPFFKAHYDAVISGLAVQATREYKPLDNGLVELSFSANSWLANLTETSRFTWQKATIKPSFFSSTQYILGIKKTSQLDFNHRHKTLTRTIQNKSEDLAYIENCLDRVSFQLQLQQDLILNKPNITYKIVHNNSIKNNQFEIIGKEIITTKAGDLKTLKIKVIRENTRRVTFIWVATEWQYLLVRLIQLKNDKEQFSIELTNAIVGNQAVTGLQL
jgi:hypothetical protein